MFLMDKILSKSNSFNYYKNNFEKSNKQLNKLKKEIKILKNKNLKLNEDNNLFKNFEEFLIETYNNPLIHPPFNNIDKRNFLFMEVIADYLVSCAENLEKQPLISVIMPVYNREDIVMKSIDSVLSQTYSNFELIIVDDASTDGTLNLLKKINHEKVRIFHHDKNKFCAGARNTGLKNAKGQYIAYLDSDNLFDERYLAALVGAFSLLPDADAIYTAQYKFETFNQDPFLIIFGTFNKSLLHNYNYIDINSFAHKKSVYEDIGGFDENYDAVEDWDLMMRMVNNNYKIYSIPVLLSLYYLHAPNRTSNLISGDYLDEISDKNQKFILKPYALNKDVNIVIPVYENDINIKKCINSILSLNIDNIKIIVSNNNSNINLNDKLNYLSENDSVKIIESNKNKGFTHALVQGLKHIDENADILILNQNAILYNKSLEAMQHYAYELKDCGLVVSQEALKDSPFMKDHVPFSRPVYWCDITPSNIYKNISNIPLFHDGECIELKFAPFFCTYIKKEVYADSCGFNLKLKDCSSMKLFSEYIRYIMGLKIYHVSDAFVINNLGNDYKVINYDYEKYDVIKNMDYSWNF